MSLISAEKQIKNLVQEVSLLKRKWRKLIIQMKIKALFISSYAVVESEQRKATYAR